MIKNDKDTVPWTYVITDPNGEEIARMFYKNQFKKQIEQSLEFEM